jgi:hypothetical protein
MKDQIAIGTRCFHGGNPSAGRYIRYSQDVEVVRETPNYWVDSSGGWFRKSDLKKIPSTKGGLALYLTPTSPDRPAPSTAATTAARPTPPRRD